MPVYTELIKALAQLAWPLIVACLLVGYRREIGNLLRGIKRGKFMGFEIEEEAQRAAIQAELAEETQPPKVADPVNSAMASAKVAREVQNREQIYLSQILDMASRDKSVALIRIFNEVENEIRQMVATFGLLQFTHGAPGAFPEYVNLMASLGYFSKELQESLLSFWKARNLVVHDIAELPESAYVSILDTGIRLLGILRSIPRETNRVAYLTFPSFRTTNAGTKSKQERASSLRSPIQTDGPSRTESSQPPRFMLRGRR